MNRSRQAPWLVVGATGLALFVAAAATWAGVQTTGQQRCLTKVTKSGLKVAKAQSKEARGCLRAASRGQLPANDGETCLRTDSRQRVAKARAKTVRADQGSCAVPPDFGYTGATAVNDAAVDEHVALTADVFGPSLALGAILRDVDRDGSSCQASAQKSYERLLATKLKSFSKCQKDGLKTSALVSDADLADCAESVAGVPDSKTAGAVAKLRVDVAKDCAQTAAATAFGSRCAAAASTDALADCLTEAVDCRVCTMLSAMHALDVDCDAYDDGLANGSCAAGSNATTTSMGSPSSSTTMTTLPATTTTTLFVEGACNNAADEAVVAAFDIQSETQTCVFGCLGSGNVSQCTADCLNAATGLSTDCGLCYGESAVCGIANCAGQCALNPSSAACLACVGTYCVPAFDLCAEGTPQNTTTTLTGGTTTTSTTTTLPGGTTTTMTPGTTTTTTLPDGGACVNAADEAVSASLDVQAEAVTCTVGCLGAGDRVACIAACLQSGTGLSNGCSQCYAQSAECGLLNCAGQCAVDQGSAPCLACLDANCIPAFDACSGLGDPPVPASCTNMMLDGDESDVDCGGSCEACAIGASCNADGDCSSGECSAGSCVPPSTPIAFGSCANGYIDPFSDPDAIDLGGTAPTGSDDGYVLTLAATSDVYVELTNQLGATTTVTAAVVAVAGDGASVVGALSTGAVVAGQNGTSGPSTLAAGTYYLYVDSAVADTFGPYEVCVVEAPAVDLGSCVSGTVGNGDGDDVQIAGPGGDKGLRFTPPASTQVIVRLRNLSGASSMAAAIFDGASKLSGSDTGDTPLFTERTAGPVTVAGGTAYTVQVDTAEVDSFGNFEVCVVEAGCGDGLVGGGEQCDDGNQAGGDGCSASCTLESGKIVVDSCRTDSIPLFPIGDDCDDWTLPISENRSIYVELSNAFGDTLLARGELRLGGSTLASTGNVAVAQSGSTAVTAVTAPNAYTVRVCDVTGAGTGTYTVCVRSARRIDLGGCFSSNVADGDGNVIDLAGPISGGDEDVLFQPPATTIVRLTLFNESVGGLLASGIYDGQPGNLLPNSAVGASPSPIPVGSSGQSGLVEVNVGQIYRVYTDIASLGTAGTDYTICLGEVAGDACLNESDENVRAAFNLDAEAESAGLSCTGNASCISQALQNDTGLSAACADCYGGTGGCAASNCALQCLGDSGSSGCRSCVASNCAEEFEICSGWVYQQ